MRRRMIGLAWLLALCSLSTAAAPGEAPATYTFGVAPQFDQRKLFATWKPVIDALAKATGQPFRFLSATSVPEFEQAIAKGRYDFIYVNPYHLHRERFRQGYIPLVRDAAPLRGVVAVRTDSAIRKLTDLDGKSLAVPSPNAIGASILIQAELERVHRVRITVVNAKSHSSAYLYAINQLSDAAGGVEKTLAEQEPAIRNALRVVFRTSDFPSHPIAAHPRIPEALRESVRQALLKLSAEPAGRALLQEIPISRAVAASFKDYDAFRALDLDAYWTEPGAAAKP